MYVSSYSDDHSNEYETNLNCVLKHALCSFVRSQILFVAIRLDLFTIIDQSPTGSLSYDELKKFRISSALLSYLVYLRLLKQCSNSNRYECTHLTRTYLVSTRENYVGLGIGVWDHRRQYTFFLRLCDTLKYGIRTSEESREQLSLWATFQHNSSPMTYFARVMSSFTRCTINELCNHADFSSYSMLLDVGGSLGDLSKTILKRNPHMSAYSFDLPELTRYALSTSTTKNSKLNYIPGDFFQHQWPDEINQIKPFIDIVSLKYILHDWSYYQREYLVGKIYKLLKEKINLSGGNGTILIIEKMIDDNRQNLTTLSTSISMAIECGDGIGFDATLNEYKGLLIKVGFQRTQIIKLMGPMIALFAHMF